MRPTVSSPPNREGGSGKSLSGRRVLITGASSGIGAATARLFDSEGASCVLVARDQARLDEVADTLCAGATTVAADVADAEAVDGLVADAFDEGGLDVVVNSAGICVPRSLDELDEAAWKEEIDVNLSGTFYVCRAAGLRMREAGGGAIVNLGSDKSSLGAAMYVAYCASKAAIAGLTRALAAELAPGVTVNALCPGSVWTPMIEAELELFDDPAAVKEKMVERVPLARIASPEEVAKAVLFLARDAPYATGGLFPLDGGLTAV